MRRIERVYGGRHIPVVMIDACPFRPAYFILICFLLFSGERMFANDHSNTSGSSIVNGIIKNITDTHIVYIPTAFSPNGDGSNDIFYVRGTGVKSMRLMIYNRDGEVVFTSYSVEDGWDGTFRGKACNTGTYVYFVQIEFFDSKMEVMKGDLTLVR